MTSMNARKILSAMLMVAWTSSLWADTNTYFGIHVVDEATGRGVPLVELETVNHMRFITDSGGWIAFCEPGLMGQKVYFEVRSHGYEFPKDGYGSVGTALRVIPGGRSTVYIKRVNLAERLYRLTGEGLYRDSVLLGEPTPLSQPLGAGLVVGQDSVLAVPYQGKLWWFWGDTLRMSYPLGHYGTAGAYSLLPQKGGLDPAKGVDFHYMTNADGFSRGVCQLDIKKGPVWVDGVLTVKDASARERLIAHYSHMESLEKVLDHGLAIFNDQKNEFERLTVLDMQDRWRFPHGHPLRVNDHGKDYFYFGDAFPNVRVPANFEQLTNPASYEAFTRINEGDSHYAWTFTQPPISVADEKAAIASGRLSLAEAHFQPVDQKSGKTIQFHHGSVNWNEYRKCWIMIAGQYDGESSLLGEIWYAEAPEPTGPWTKTIKVVTHNKYSFYNPVQHPFFDQGRFIYFEGTYVNMFSGNLDATPRYDYNQILYRLDLDDARLKQGQ